MTSPKTSFPLPSVPILYRRSAVSGVGWLSLSASSTRPSKTASALPTAVSSPRSTISFPRTMTSHPTSSSTRLKTASRSPNTSNMRPGGTTSLASTWLPYVMSVSPPQPSDNVVLILQPFPHEGGEPPPIRPVSGQRHHPAHHGPHVLHARGTGLRYRLVGDPFQLLVREGSRKIAAHDPGLGFL